MHCHHHRSQNLKAYMRIAKKACFEPAGKNQGTSYWPNLQSKVRGPQITDFDCKEKNVCHHHNYGLFLREDTATTHSIGLIRFHLLRCACSPVCLSSCRILWKNVKFSHDKDSTCALFIGVKASAADPSVNDTPMSRTRLENVQQVEQEDIDSGRFSIEEVVLPLPGSQMLYPSHSTGAVSSQSSLTNTICSDHFIG